MVQSLTTINESYRRSLSSTEVAEINIIKSKRQKVALYIAIVLVISLDIYYLTSFSLCDAQESGNLFPQHCSFERTTSRHYEHTWEQYIAYVTVILNFLMIVIFLFVFRRIIRMFTVMYKDIYLQSRCKMRSFIITYFLFLCFRTVIILEFYFGRMTTFDVNLMN